MTLSVDPISAEKPASSKSQGPQGPPSESFMTPSCRSSGRPPLAQFGRPH